MIKSAHAILMHEDSRYPRKAAYDEIWLLNAVSERLERAESLIETRKVFENALEVLGFRLYVYFWFFGALRNRARPFVQSNISDDSWRASVESNEYRMAAWAEWCSLHLTPFGVNQSDSEDQVRTPDCPPMTFPTEFAEALAVPIHCPGSDIALMLLSPYRPDGDQGSPLDARRNYVHLLAIHFHAAVARLRDGQNQERASVNLTNRERDCLTWLAQGKTSWEVAIILDISERTVNFHIGNAMKKLGVHNRTHAIAKAIAMGLVDI